MDQVRALTKRRVPLKTKELIERLNPVLRGWGHYYKQGSRPKALQPTRPLDRAAHLVASVQALAQCAAGDSYPKRKLYGEYGLVNLVRIDSFACISEDASLRESCMRENRTCSLSGGRRPARKRASSDPTGHDVGKASEALRMPKGGAMDRPSRERWPKARTRRRGR